MQWILWPEQCESVVGIQRLNTRNNKQLHQESGGSLMLHAWTVERGLLDQCDETVQLWRLHWPTPLLSLVSTVGPGGHGHVAPRSQWSTQKYLEVSQ